MGTGEAVVAGSSNLPRHRCIYWSEEIRLMDVTAVGIVAMVLAGLAAGVHLFRRSGREQSWLERIESERRSHRLEPPAGTPR